MYKTALLDLDGTVIDSARGVINSVVYALERLGIAPPARESLYSFIGPPLLHSFEAQFGLSGADGEHAVSLYREYYRDRGIYEIDVYDGIPELLSTLRERGRRIILATSKPEPFAEQILGHIGLDRYFDAIAGATFDGTRLDKEDVLRYAFERVGIKPDRDSALIGDTKYDIIGARSVGIDSIGVLYGYGSCEEMVAEGATHIVETALDSLAFF